MTSDSHNSLFIFSLKTIEYIIKKNTVTIGLNHFDKYAIFIMKPFVELNTLSEIWSVCSSVCCSSKDQCS